MAEILVLYYSVGDSIRRTANPEGALCPAPGRRLAEIALQLAP